MADESSTMSDVQQEVGGPETPPTVSVIIPAFNAAAYIRESLDSVFGQTFTSYEVIVINDGSPDTAELERKLKGYPISLRYIKQENRGAAAARNVGLRSARGEFVAFLDADDTWLPNFLEEQIELLRSTNVDLVYSDALLFGKSHMAGRTFMELHPSRAPVTAENLLATNVTVLTSTVLARKGPIFEVGLFDEAMRRGHDFALWLRLARFGARFAYQRKVLAHYRIGESGLSGNAISQLERSLAVLEAIKTRGELTASEEVALDANLNRTLAQLAIEKGKDRLLGKDFGGALESFKEAKKLRHGWKLMVVCFALRIAPQMLWRIYHQREMALRNG